MIQEEFPNSIVDGGLLLCVGMFLGLLWGVAWDLRVGPYNWYKIVPDLVELPSKYNKDLSAAYDSYRELS
jgi:hypothetical protein